MTLLQQRDLDRRQRRLEVYADTRRDLRNALTELLSGYKVIIFGSLTMPGVFNDCSDIDIALETAPPQIDLWIFASEVMERLQRPVDVVSLSHCRFRDKILREGETWTL